MIKLRGWSPVLLPLLLCAAALCGSCWASFNCPFDQALLAGSEPVPCWWQQRLDHFDFRHSDVLWPQRFLVNAAHWNGSATAPILFYCGNEAAIDEFYVNSGFLTGPLAESLGALVVFAEHRYYGQSLPFGNDSFSPEHLAYLSSSQALADYSELIPALKSALGIPGAPVIATGGSYGGMLAAWFRIKYPNVVDMAYAASAPILLFKGAEGITQWDFERIITADYETARYNCSAVMRSMLELMQSSHPSTLNPIFKPCKPLVTAEDIQSLIHWATYTLITMAEVDYPYPTDFIAPVPAWPVNTSCSLLDYNATSVVESLSSFSLALQVASNYSGTETCVDLSEYTQPDMLRTIHFNLKQPAWGYQACTSIACWISFSPEGMFLPATFDFDLLTKRCNATYGVTPLPSFPLQHYGGIRMPHDLESASRIIFTNGLLDPWRSGGVQEDISPSVVALLIPEGAHHLDLRQPNPLDPDSVRTARETVQQLLHSWLHKH